MMDWEGFSRKKQSWAIRGTVLAFALSDWENSGPGSSVGIATDYGLDGRGSNPGRARFSTRPDRPWGLPSLLYNGCRVLPEGKVRPGRAADHSLPSSGAVMEE